jgi:hypothetical protein
MLFMQFIFEQQHMSAKQTLVFSYNFQMELSILDHSGIRSWLLRKEMLNTPFTL